MNACANDSVEIEIVEKLISAGSNINHKDSVNLFL